MHQNTTHSGILGFIEKLLRLIPIIYIFSRSLIKYTNYFEEDFDCLKIIFKDKKINIIDVGASDGIASKFFLNNLNVKKILCFEPQSIFFNDLKKLKKSNKQINIYKFGLSSNKNYQTLHVPYVNFFDKKYYLSTYTFPKKEDLLKQIKTDFLISPKIEKIKIKINKPKLPKYKFDLIKIDTNGSELSVILALKKVIKRDRPVLIIENNDIKNINFYLKKMEYSKYYYFNGNLYPHKNEKSVNVIFKTNTQ